MGAVSQNALDNKFIMFTSDELMSHSDGLGLSLTTVKMVMEYHNGEIDISNCTKGKGAIVKLIFPIDK